ncbi:MAG: ATP-dependent Clp protease proteolytic subunit, partial [Duodenibacillus sp.]
EENVVGIYAEKTGRTPEEIREKLDAESYFTAEEAVAFGLADEVDETTEVRNVCSGGFVMLNGLRAEAKLFEHAPKGFIKAEEPQASATKKEVQRMNLEQLKAEYPDLVQAIREEAAAEARQEAMADARKEAFAEGVKAERERIRAIEDITSSDDYKDLADQAKFETGITAEALAVLILKADKTRREKMLKEREEDAKDLDGTANEGNVGIVGNKESAELSLQKRLTEACKYRRG